MQEYPVDLAALARLFDPSVPDNPVLWAVLKGRHTGKAVVDDARQPSLCVLRTDAVLTFLSQQIDQLFLNEAVAHFRKTGDVWLVWQSKNVTQLVAPAATNVVQRLEFFDYDAGSQILANLRERLPAGCAIRPIDRQILERCEWRSDMAFYCGSEDNFLANGMGLCMMCDDEIMVEAYVSSFGERKAEIGAITRRSVPRAWLRAGRLRLSHPGVRAARLPSLLEL